MESASWQVCAADHFEMSSRRRLPSAARSMLAPRMRALLASLSLGSGALLLAVLSAGVVWLLSSLLPKALRWLWVVIVPFILAYCLYWSPVWLGSDPSEYSAWAVLCVGTWFLAGAVSSTLTVLILRKHRTE